MEKETKKNFYDLAKEQEMSFAVMNMIAAEEHLALTSAKTKNSKYLEVYDALRKVRSKYMKDIVKHPEGESWCISKPLLITSMRLIETGIKYNSDGDEKKAMTLMQDALDVWQLFWLIQKLGDKVDKDGIDG